jgi:hypothetical protein
VEIRISIFQFQRSMNAYKTSITNSGITGLVREKMSLGKKNSFADKHEGSTKLDPSIKEAVLKRSKEGDLPCTIAFEIVKELGVEAAEVGKTVDLLNFRLVKCQLGLFGYIPEKKILKPQSTDNQDLKDAILNAQIDGRLPCKNAWEIASEFEISKMMISNIAEAMKIKIKPCQLGAF